MTARKAPTAAHQEPQARLYVPIIRATEAFGLSESTLRRAAKRGQIKIYSASGRALVRVSEVAAMIEGRQPIGAKIGG